MWEQDWYNGEMGGEMWEQDWYNGEMGGEMWEQDWYNGEMGGEMWEQDWYNGEMGIVGKCGVQGLAIPPGFEYWHKLTWELLLDKSNWDYRLLLLLHSSQHTAPME